MRRGPSLSFSLLSEIGEGDLQQGGGGGSRRPGGGPPVTAVAARKARRKQERVDKSRRVRAWRQLAGFCVATAARWAGQAAARCGVLLTRLRVCWLCL